MNAIKPDQLKQSAFSQIQFCCDSLLQWKMSPRNFSICKITSLNFKILPTSMITTNIYWSIKRKKINNNESLILADTEFF